MRRFNYALLLIIGSILLATAHHAHDPTFNYAVGLIALLGALTASV